MPVEEHQSSLQVNMFDGYAVFGISENNTAEPEEEKTEHPEKEEQNYCLLYTSHADLPDSRIGKSFHLPTGDSFDLLNLFHIVLRLKQLNRGKRLSLIHI